MLTVWCVCWGDKYPDYYVQRLKDSVAAALPLQHRFLCLSDRSIEGVETRAPAIDYPGWWQKIGLFKPGVADAHNLYLDLDVVVVSSLEWVVQYTECDFAAPNNWAQSGWNSIQSSVMLWKGGTGNHASIIYQKFEPERLNWPPVNQPGVLWGDQEFCTELRDQGDLKQTPIDPALVKSYKYHVRPTGTVPDGASVIVFHGKPDPHEVSESWFRW